MHRGYTKRWRKRWDKDYCKDHLLFTMMEYFIDFANWKDTEVEYFHKGKLVRIIKLKRGQHIFTIKGLAKRLGTTRDKVRRRIHTLTHTNMDFLHIKTHTNYSIATIRNYNKYQSEDCLEPHQNPQQTAKNPHQNPHQPHTPNNYKNIIKNEEEKIALPEWLDKSVWAEYKKYRGNGKNKLTPYAEKRAIMKLEKLRQAGNDPTEVIHESMICGWSGLFPLNRNKNNNQEQETPEQWLERQRKRRS